MADFRLFGPLAGTIDGEEVDLGPPKQRTLLSVLLLHADRFVSTDTLIDSVWEGRAPRTANHSIQLYVSSLRRILEGAAHIATEPGGYRLILDGSLDIREFEEDVEAALDLHRSGRIREAASTLGEALDLREEAPLADSAYAEFAQPAISRLDELYAIALETIAGIDLELGRPQEALLRANELVSLHPLRQPPREIQMRALHQLGRQPEALRAYREYVDHLGTELGVGPSPEMQLLEEQVLLHDPALTTTRVTPTTRNPFKGLRAFQRADAPDFFGRDHLTTTIVERLADNPPLVSVVGPSGAGKSSVVLAGVLPLLLAEPEARARAPCTVTLNPGSNPQTSLGLAFEATACRRSGGTTLARVGAGIEACGRVVLVIDQFEELFTQARAGDATAFLDGLCEAAAAFEGRFSMLITLRADYYGNPLLHPCFAGLFAGSVIDVPPLTPSEIEEAVCGPAQGVGLPVEPALVPILVADMGRGPDALAHLQYALTEMAEPGRGLTVDAYERLGRMDGLIGRTADRALERLSPAAREASKQVFLRLVAVDGTAVARRSAPMRELLDAVGDPSNAHAVLSGLIEARLLTADRDPASGAASVAVTHESLLSGWGQLARWIAEHQGDIRLHGQLRDATAEWEAAQHNADFLLAGARLARYADWVAKQGIRLTPGEAAFLGASAKAEEELADSAAEQAQDLEQLGARARHRLWGLAAAIIVAVAAITYSVLALRPESPPRIAVLTEEFQGTFTEQVNAATLELPDAETFAVGTKTVVETIDDLARRGTRLIVTLAQWESVVLEAAERYPDVHFAVLDRDAVPPPPDLPNLTFIGFREEEGSFIAGAAAALASESQHIGFIGGVESPTIFAFQAGFEQGARAISPGIEIEKVYLGVLPDLSGFNSFTLAAVVTTEMLEDGVDVVFPAAGDSAQGSLEAARRHLARTGHHAWIVGVDTEMRAEIDRQVAELAASGVVDEEYLTIVAAWKDHVLTSMVKDLGAALSVLDQQERNATLEPGTISLGLTEGAVGLAPDGGAVDEYLPILTGLESEIRAGARSVSRIPAWDYERVFPLLPEEAAYWDAVWQANLGG